MRPRSKLSLHSVEDGRRYLLLFGLQTIGVLIIVGVALPFYRNVIADPAAHVAQVAPLICGSTAVALIQTGFWIRHRLRPPLPQFHNALIGYVILFLGRMTFVLASAIFGFVFIIRRPEFQFPVSRYFLTLAGLFAYFCYTQELEQLGRALIGPDPSKKVPPAG